MCAGVVGEDHAMCLTEDGTLLVWGLNRFGQLGYNSLFVLLTTALKQGEKRVRRVRSVRSVRSII